MGIFDKFKVGFKKSASSFTSGLKNIIVKKEIDDKILDQIEEYLIQSDVGLSAAEEIKKIIAQEKIDPKKDTMSEVNIILKNYIINLMKPLENKNFFSKKDKLNATLVSGVNGVGKTTTIGKIGKILKSNGNKVMFSACDTFRAAAIEQLEDWAKKVDVQVTKSNQGSDPASVAYKAGKGRVVVFGEAAMFTAQLLGGISWMKLGMNHKNCPYNYKLFLNCIHWLDGLLE